MKSFTIKELASILDITYSACRRRIKRENYETSHKHVNDRMVTIVKLNDDQLDDLLLRVNLQKSKGGVIDRSMTNDPNVSDRSMTDDHEVTYPQNSADVEDSIIEPEIMTDYGPSADTIDAELVKSLVERLMTASDKIIEMAESKAENEKRLYLLEDKNYNYALQLEQKNDDVELYKNKYFELKYQVDEFQKKLEQHEKTGIITRFWRKLF